MLILILCAAFALPRTEGSIKDQMTEVTQLCCNQGTTYASNHTVEDCSSSIPPDVPSSFGSFCLLAMDQCCKVYFQKKNDCQIGIDIALGLKSCSSTEEYTKTCCEQCMAGVINGKTRGPSSCSVLAKGKNAEQLLPGEAFTKCCQNAVNRDHDNIRESASNHRNSLTISKKPVDDDLTSVCEEYAPTELCAHHCIPIPGSYKCECNPGFMLMADGKNCIEVTKNRCKPHNPCQHKCNDNGIEVKCSCRRGYHLKSDGKSCEDIDECKLDPPVCLPNTQCYNVLGSYKCIPLKTPKTFQNKGQCPAGFARNLANNACDDINECKLPSPPCASYLCENTIGGYKCGGAYGDPANLSNKPRSKEDRCPSGFKSGLNDECEDVDECARSEDDCNKLSQFCINTHGDFYCQDKASKRCPPGFKTNAITNKCEDIDECEDGEDICKPDQICINVPGQYDCKPRAGFGHGPVKCPDGMRIDRATRRCEDIDECVEGTHLCDQHQKCLNTNGSHECRCKVGFELDPMTGACIDINECATDQNNCISQSQRCDNTVGSYLCVRFISCGTGYILQHSSGNCEDIDECALGIHNCNHAGPQYQCLNIPGSFRCQKLTTPAPKQPETVEYDYYYDSEEEVEDDKSNKTETVTTTRNPTTTSTSTTTPKTSELPTQPRVSYKEPTTTEKPKIEFKENIENNVDLNNTSKNRDPAFKEPEYDPVIKNTEPDIDNEIYIPITPKSPRQTDKPSISGKTDIKLEHPYVSREPEYNYFTDPPIPKPIKPNSPNTERNDLPEIFTVTETTYSPLPVKSTSPSPRLVNEDTNEVPKNKWSKINEKPVDCQIGFVMDSYGACYDIDECATNKHSCSGLTEVCRNTLGSYHCECAAYFQRDLASGLCIPITPPTTSSTSTSTTPSTTSSTSTSTTPPTTSSTTTSTTPPTTSSTSTSTTTTITTTTPAPTTSSTRSYFYGYPDFRNVKSRPFKPRSSCDIGYLFNSQNGKCEDINECTNGQASCASVEICINTDGGYRCDCLPNWTFDRDRHRCVPVRIPGQFPLGYGNAPAFPPPDRIPNIPVIRDEKKITEPEEKEVDSPPSPCRLGTRLGNNNVCEDIDECATGEAQCGHSQKCTNLYGGYTCSCSPGFRLVGDHVCEDVDECAVSDRSPACSQNAECVNTLGYYRCECHEGFRSAPIADKVCIDVDECSENRPGALCSQICNNVWGRYRCSCYRGYRLNPDNRTCSDIDECTEYKSKNLCVGHCVNEQGKYRCACPRGYRLSEDNRSCIDIDECETGTAPCAHAQAGQGKSVVCLNTRGGYRCQKIVCPPGYELKDKHLCSKTQTYCAPNDYDCIHQPSTYSYNFITFVSKLYLPDGKIDLFHMRGPNYPNVNLRFELKLINVNAPPSVKEKADMSSFMITQDKLVAVTSLVKSLEGPQSIELEVCMKLFDLREQYAGKVVAKLFIHVSEYEF